MNKVKHTLGLASGAHLLPMESLVVGQAPKNFQSFGHIRGALDQPGILATSFGRDFLVHFGSLDLLISVSKDNLH